MIDRFFKTDSWLSSVIDRKATRVDFDESLLSQGKDFKDALSHYAFAFSKVPVANVRAVSFFEKNGFQLIDTNVSFLMKKNEMVSASVFAPDTKDEVSLRFSEGKDESQVADLAYDSFNVSRFHLDRQFSKGEGARVKAEWVRNFFRGHRGDKMVIAEENGEVVGFVLLIDQNRTLKKEGSWLIDLIGVRGDRKGRGIGPKMIRFATENCAGLKSIDVGTQLANATSIKMYEKLGFRFQEAAYVFHYHNQTL